MGALNRKLLRDLWHIRAQAVAIALVIGCGLAVFVMALGIIDSLEETRSAYYERYRFADVFASVKRAPEHLVEPMSRLPGVKAVATRIVKDVTLDVPGLHEPATGRLISLPERRRPVLNDIVLRVGRWVSAGRPDEVVISEPFAEAHELAPGGHLWATINGRKRKLQVVGVALSPEYVYAIAPDTEGRLWVGTDRGIGLYDGQGFETRTVRDGLVNDDVQCLLEDRSGSIWIGTRSGLSRYRDGTFESFTRREGLAHNTITALHESTNGRLWVGTLAGLALLDGNRVRSFTQRDGRRRSAVSSLTEDDRGIPWVGYSTAGVDLYDGRLFQQFVGRDGFPVAYVTGLHRDDGGTIWIADG